MDPRRLTEVDFDRIADSNDLHLVQALRVTARQLDADDAPSGKETDRLRSVVAGLLDDVTSTTKGPGRAEQTGDRFERFYTDDQERVDRARAALMAYGDRPTEETAAMAADAVTDLHDHH